MDGRGGSGWKRKRVNGRGKEGEGRTVVREEGRDGEPADESRVAVCEHDERHANEADPGTVRLEVAARSNVCQ